MIRDFQELRELILLDVIRRGRISIDYNQSRYVRPAIDSLIANEFLTADYQIALEGKKTLLMFDDVRRDLLKDFDVYKEVNVNGRLIDARLPVITFDLRNQKGMNEGIYFATLLIKWDEIVKQIIEYNKLEELLTTDWLNWCLAQILQQENWTILGKTRKEAAMTATLLLDPAQLNTQLVQITR